MKEMNQLAEQHLLESASRLRHIDELMARARVTPVNEDAAIRTEALLRQIQADRDKLAQDLETLQRLPRGDASVAAAQGVDLKGLLESVGLQLEKVLATLFERDKQHQV